MSFLSPISKALSVKDSVSCPSGYSQAGTVDSIEILCCPNGYHQSSSDSFLCSKNGLPTVAIVGIVVAAFALFIISTIAFIIRRRRLRALQNSPVAQYNEKYNPSSFNNNVYQPQQQNYNYGAYQPNGYTPQIYGANGNQYNHPAY